MAQKYEYPISIAIAVGQEDSEFDLRENLNTRDSIYLSYDIQYYLRDRGMSDTIKQGIDDNVIEPIVNGGEINVDGKVTVTMCIEGELNKYDITDEEREQATMVLEEIIPDIGEYVKEELEYRIDDDEISSNHVEIDVETYSRHKTTEIRSKDFYIDITLNGG